MVFFVLPAIPFAAKAILAAGVLLAGMVAVDETADTDFHLKDDLAQATATVTVAVVTPLVKLFGSDPVPENNTEPEIVVVLPNPYVNPDSSDSIRDDERAAAAASWGYICINETALAPRDNVDPDEGDYGEPPSSAFNIYAKAYNSGASAIILFLMLFAGIYYAATVSRTCREGRS